MEPTQTPPQPEQTPQSSSNVAPQSAQSQPHEPKASKPSRFAGLRTFLSVLAFVGGIVIAATLINQFIFQSYYVDGTSMTPTLNNNDRLIIDKVERTFALVGGRHYVPQRGQVVVLDSSLVDQTGHNEQLIKRVIGLPGETITIDSEGTVTIKNQDNPDGFNVDNVLGLNLGPTHVDTSVNLTIPNNQVYVMGDNRSPGGSFDSRSFGPIDTSKIQGRLLARIFPFNQTQFF